MNNKIIQCLQILSLMRVNKLITLRCYERAVEKLKKRDYREVIDVLKPYDREKLDLFDKYADMLCALLRSN